MCADCNVGRCELNAALSSVADEAFTQVMSGTNRLKMSALAYI